MKFTYKFPAVRGIQAGEEYYISMVPLKLLPKLFLSEDDVVLPEYRAQRRINEARIPEIKDYILNNPKNYVFSALSASIDGDFVFLSNNNSDAGLLEVDMNSVFLINDGQHRKAAIEAALLENEKLGDETISIVFFKDSGLTRSQQMFTDLNKHAVKSSNSLSTLYDSRDEMAILTKKTIERIQFFNKYTDKERDILGKNSSKLFTLSTMYAANQKILHNSSIDKNSENFVFEFWNNVSRNIVEWNELENKEISKKDLRENYIITLSVTIKSFGRLGRFFYNNKSVNMRNKLEGLKKIDWNRASENWLNRTIRKDGKVINSEEAMLYTCSKIKQLLHIELTEEEKQKEKILKRNKK